MMCDFYISTNYRSWWSNIINSYFKIFRDTAYTNYWAGGLLNLIDAQMSQMRPPNGGSSCSGNKGDLIPLEIV